MIRIVVQPDNKTVKLKRVEEIVTLHCQAESPSGQQLEYKWYYLSSFDKPSTINRKTKSVKGTSPLIDLPLTISSKSKRRYFCDVSVVDQPDYHVASNVAVITTEPGKLSCG